MMFGKEKDQNTYQINNSLSDENEHCWGLKEEKNEHTLATRDEIVIHYENANKDNLIQRLLLKKWVILNEIEQFLIDTSENYFNYDDDTDINNSHVLRCPSQHSSEAAKRNQLNVAVLNLIKQQNDLRTKTLMQGQYQINIMQTSNNISALRSLNVNDLNEILHDFDTIQRDVRELIISQQGTLIFTTIPIDETIDYLLRGYHIINQY